MGPSFGSYLTDEHRRLHANAPSHWLRATAATRTQEHGGSIVDAALHLGHSTSSMGRFAITVRYTDPNESHRRWVAELTILPAERSAEVNVITRQAG